MQSGEYCAAATFSLGLGHLVYYRRPTPRVHPGGVPSPLERARVQACSRQAREATMDLRMRLNILGAVMSFGFLTAIVFELI